MQGEDVPAEAPPVPLADYIALCKAAMQRQGAGQVSGDRNQAWLTQLAAVKLTVYEWNIVHHWWMQRMLRDQDVMRQYTAAVSGN
jgi:hypothetical protein